MTISRLQHFYVRAGVVTVLIAVTSLFGAGFGTHSAAAAPLNSVPSISVTIPAGGSATLELRGIAIQPGTTLPHDTLALAQQALPDDHIRAALYYGIEWGYAQSNPQQVALAIWYMQSGTWLSDDHAIAARIANAAAASPGLPAWYADGRSITSLAAQGQITLSGLNLVTGSMSQASGSGVLTLRNTGSQDIVAYLPYGTIFGGASGSVLVWAVGQGQPQPQPTQAATETPQPPAASNTPQAQPTSYKAGFTPPVESTATTAPSSKGATATTISTATSVPASDTPVATATQAPAGDPPQAEATQVSSKKDPVSNNTGSAPQPKSGTAPSGQPAASQKPATTAAQAPSAPVHTAPSASAPSAPAADSASGPPPVNTPAKDGATAPPPPVVTSQPGAQQVTPPVPQPQLTKIAPIPVEATPTTAKKEESPTPTAPTKESPTPLPSKVPTVPPVAPGGPPEITAGGEPAVPPQIQPPASQGATGQGSPPTTPPTTGGGPSSTPVWLAFLSAIMVLGGWSLRRMSSAVPEAAKVEAAKE